MSDDGNDRIIDQTGAYTKGAIARSVFFVGKGDGGILYMGGSPAVDRQNALWTINSATGGIGITVSASDLGNVTYLRRDKSSLANKTILGHIQNTNGAVLNNFQFSLNGEPLSAKTYQSNGNGTFAPNIQSNKIAVGAKISTQSTFNTNLLGKVGEIVMFDRALDATETNKVNSYLALKYGISLDQSVPQNYTASDDTVMWSHAKAGSYNKDIFGIGRDNESFGERFNQTLSRATDSGDILTAALRDTFTGALQEGGVQFENDVQFMMFANNGGSLLTTAAELPPGATRRVTREWQAQKTANHTQSTWLKFDGHDASWRLILDDDGDFTSGITNLGPLSSQGVKEWTNPTDNTYFTLAQIPNGGINVSKTSIDVGENGGTETFEVTLSTQPDPGTQVVMSVVSGAVGEATVSTSTLTFTYANWNTPQTVTVTGVDDDIVQSTQTTVTVRTVGGTTDSRFQSLSRVVQVRIIEDDIAELVIGLTGEGGLDGITIYEDGGTARINVSLSTQPTNNVVINLSVANTDEATVSPASLTFTPQNWNDLQLVTVTAVDDNIVRDDSTTLTIAVNIASSAPEYSEATPLVIPITIIGNDVAGFTVTPTSLSVGENGGTGTFTVVLDTEPLMNVVLNVVSSDIEEATVSPATLTFTPQNWNTPQTVTVTGVDDDIPNIDYTAVITVSVNRESSDLTYADVDDKTVHVLLVNDDNNSAPTNILLNGGDTVVVRDDVPVGGAIASISAVDEDVDDVHTFTLTCSAP